MMPSPPALRKAKTRLIHTTKKPLNQCKISFDKSPAFDLQKSETTDQTLSPVKRPSSSDD
jgi:hypothetical protein